MGGLLTLGLNLQSLQAVCLASRCIFVLLLLPPKGENPLHHLHAQWYEVRGRENNHCLRGKRWRGEPVSGWNRTLKGGFKEAENIESLAADGHELREAQIWKLDRGNGGREGCAEPCRERAWRGVTCKRGQGTLGSVLRSLK